MNNAFRKTRANIAQLSALRRKEKVKRQYEMGILEGILHPSGSFFKKELKGIQFWYDTRTLVQKVTEIMDRNEKTNGKRICHINCKWQLQIRGKHLRRLLKSMPRVKHVGGILIEVNDIC